MDTKELLKKVRKIEIKTKGLTNNVFAGEYHSAFKGKGMTFSEVREYQFGDDIRNIDWNVTARFGHPYIKVFEEEREMTVIILIDISNSIKTGANELKSNRIAELTALIAFSASQNNDKIGAIFFSNKIEKFIPPQKGKSHILRIIREVINFSQPEEGKPFTFFKNIFKRIEPQNHRTDIAESLRFLTNAITKKSTVFLISDFEADDFSKAIRIANQKHDLIALYVYDQIEVKLPKGFYIRAEDAETGNIKDINAKNEFIRSLQEKRWNEKNEKLTQTFRKSGVDFAMIPTDKDYVKPLINLFKKR